MDANERNLAAENQGAENTSTDSDYDYKAWEAEREDDATKSLMVATTNDTVDALTEAFKARPESAYAKQSRQHIIASTQLSLLDKQYNKTNPNKPVLSMAIEDALVVMFRADNGNDEIYRQLRNTSYAGAQDAIEDAIRAGWLVTGPHPPPPKQ